MARKMMALGIVGLLILVGGVILAISHIYLPNLLGVNKMMLEILILIIYSMSGGGFQTFYISQAMRRLNITNFIINVMFIAGIISIIVGGIFTIVGWTLHAKKE